MSCCLLYMSHVFCYTWVMSFAIYESCLLLCISHVFCYIWVMSFAIYKSCLLLYMSHDFCYIWVMSLVMYESCLLLCVSHVFCYIWVMFCYAWVMPAVHSYEKEHYFCSALFQQRPGNLRSLKIVATLYHALDKYIMAWYCQHKSYRFVIWGVND